MLGRIRARVAWVSSVFTSGNTVAREQLWCLISVYPVLLHFAETYFTAAGDREFNVAINGTTVLTNLDVYGTVGKDAAPRETFNTTENSTGQIVIAFTSGAVNQPSVAGLEIR